MRSKFGALLKRMRLARGFTLREFCLKNGFDPGNYSRLERGLFRPPQSSDAIEKYASALGLERGSDDWIEMFDIASAERGVIPPDLLSDEEVVQKLPALFRTLRATRVNAQQLDELVERVRRG